jgi:large subunit ribosomal protein LP0
MAEAGLKRKERKARYKAKFEKLLGQYQNMLVIGVDNVGSLQLQKVRIALRGKAEMIMGKNTLMRMIVREVAVANPKLEAVVPLLKGNVGLVFTNDDLVKVRAVITEYKTPAAAKSGTMAPTDVFVPPGPTGLDPGQTGFFQALNISTKIVKGAIEIAAQVHLIRKGDKVTSSAVALLSKLDIKPFFYGLVVSYIYENGSVYPSSVLDITPDALLGKFMAGVGKLAALSLAARFPTQLTVSFYLANGFRKILALSAETNYKFKEAEEILAAGAAAAAAAPVAAAAGPAAAGKPAAAAVVEAAPAEEPEDNVGVGGLFD